MAYRRVGSLLQDPPASNENSHSQMWVSFHASPPDLY